MAMGDMSAQETSRLREGIIALAREAAIRILAIYDSEFAVAHKADKSPLTAADMAAHHCIVDGLERLTADIPALSEESAEDVPAIVRRQWQRMWLVDPLDGTREFVKRNGEFTVNIALIDGHRPMLGIAHNVRPAIRPGAAAASPATSPLMEVATCARAIPRWSHSASSRSVSLLHYFR